MRPDASSRTDIKSRIYYNFTQLPSRFRKVITLNGKSLHSIDVSNCQPCLSVSLIYKHLLRKTGKSKAEFKPPSDFVHYQEMCETGELYKELGKKYNQFRKEDELRYAKETYNEFKIQCFAEIFYSKRPSGTLGRVFTDLFPTVATAMKEIKERKAPVNSTNGDKQKTEVPLKPHAQFAVRLQQYESKLMLETALKPLLMEGHLLLPLHDALFVGEPELVPVVQQLIASEFLRLYNVQIKTKTEDVLASKKRRSLKKQKQKENEEWFQQFVNNKSVNKVKEGVASAGMGILIDYRSCKVKFDSKHEARHYKRQTVEKIINRTVATRNRAIELLDNICNEMKHEMLVRK